MKDIVRLKSYPNGIRIVIAEDALFGDVLAEVSEKFKDSERFFGKAKLAQEKYAGRVRCHLRHHPAGKQCEYCLCGRKRKGRKL